ncbi:MAG TPA: hypothetical protein VK469_22910 [Candidatus Kapabacteria bacterium]|nr:hypothetical protein [Candidatus Kapabacteria bacterium]
MRIKELTPKPDWTLAIVPDDGRMGIFNVAPYLEFEAFLGTVFGWREGH